MRILGISLSHDSGVTLLEDGKILYAVSEERFCRDKGFTGLPECSLNWMKNQLGGDFSSLDGVGVANRVQGNPPPVLSDLSDAKMPAWQWKLLNFGCRTGLDRWILGTQPGVRLYQEVFRHFDGAPYRRLRKLLEEGNCPVQPRKFDHHSAHLLSSICTSGWDDCLAISMDCFGDAVGGRVGIFKNGRLKLIAMTPMFHSIGYYYLFATHACGFPKGYHCGKTTGLAAYSDGKEALPFFRKRMVFDSSSGKILNHGRFLYDALAEIKSELKGMSMQTIASAVQTVTEEVVVSFIKHWLRKTHQSRLALAGGIFANVKLNQRIAALAEVEELFVHPHMGDGGLSTGAAYACLGEQMGVSLKPYRLPHAFLGTCVKVEGLDEKLKKNGLTGEKQVNIHKKVAELLSQGKVVARVSGAMEYGPRALGNRSILYQPTDPTVNEWLNVKLHRSEFMPFAPMILDIDAHEMLKGYSEKQSLHTAEFMTITYDVTEKCKKECPAVVHIDGTARPQILRKEVNPDCYQILAEYKALTGLKAIINTSYNMHDEPIVASEDDAIRAFVLSELDYLVLNDYLVLRAQ